FHVTGVQTCALPIYDAADFQLSFKRVPIVGKVTAGEPILATENIEDYFPLPDRFVGDHEDVFMLQVVGDSMIEAGIFDGDYVIEIGRASCRERVRMW